MRKIYNEKGSLTSFYRGYYITILGMIPYAGLSFSSYDRIKHLVLKNKIKILTAESPFAGEYDSTYSSSTQNSTNKKYFELTVIGKLVCGGMTGALTQTVTYPIDVIRRHMQLVTMIKDSSLNEYNIIKLSD
jgi:solute carrier family 25 protein 16